MSDVTQQPAGPAGPANFADTAYPADPADAADAALRASDAEREQIVALLQRSFTDGRLTQAELEERAGAAYAALTRAQLRELTADLPTAEKRPPAPRTGARTGTDPRVLIILLCVHPPAGLVYWLITRRRTSHSQASAN